MDGRLESGLASRSKSLQVPRGPIADRQALVISCTGCRSLSTLFQ